MQRYIQLFLLQMAKATEEVCFEAVWRPLLIAPVEEMYRDVQISSVRTGGRCFYPCCQLFISFCWKLLSSVRWQQSVCAVSQHFLG